TSPITINSQNTNSTGQYSVTGLVAPSTAGSYNIQAHFAGDSLYSAIDSPVRTLTVTTTSTAAAPAAPAATSTSPSPSTPQHSTNNTSHSHTVQSAKLPPTTIIKRSTANNNTSAHPGGSKTPALATSTT